MHTELKWFVWLQVHFYNRMIPLRWGFKSKSADVQEGLYLAFKLQPLFHLNQTESRTTKNGSTCWVSKDGKKSPPPDDTYLFGVCDSKCGYPPLKMQAFINAHFLSLFILRLTPHSCWVSWCSTQQKKKKQQHEFVMLDPGVFHWIVFFFLIRNELFNYNWVRSCEF